MEDSPKNNRRAYYRLRYPKAERPKLLSGDQVYEVSEISEKGLRVVLEGAEVQRAEPFSGVLSFFDGEEIKVVGTVFRSDERETVVKLTTGISLKRMLDEQLRIREKYPRLHDT